MLSLLDFVLGIGVGAVIGLLVWVLIPLLALIPLALGFPWRARRGHGRS